MIRSTAYLLALTLFSCQERLPVEVVVKDPPQEIEVDIEEAVVEEPEINETLVLSSYSTKYKTEGKYKSRASNIAQAAENLNGVILYPGEEFSFNGVVGQRKKSSGFKKAPVYMKGLSTLGMGGGICQVSSTLYAAAMLGRLEITERNAHSRPSDYIPIGMDATVSWPELDLRFKNNKEVPLKFAAQTSNGEITISIIGCECDYEVKHYFRIYKTIPFETKYIIEEELDEPYVKQKGKDGKPGTMMWQYLRGGVVFDKVKVRSRYMPVNEFLVVNEKPEEENYTR